MTDTLLIYVVEDEPLIQDVMRLALEDGGFAVETAADGEAAVAALAARPEAFRALVTDVNLRPDGLLGWDVARRGRELNPDLPVIYMTAAAAGDWGSRGVPGSVLLTKPFAPAQLVTAVAALLNAAAQG